MAQKVQYRVRVVALNPYDGHAARATWSLPRATLERAFTAHTYRESHLVGRRFDGLMTVRAQRRTITTRTTEGGATVRNVGAWEDIEHVEYAWIPPRYPREVFEASR